MLTAIDLFCGAGGFTTGAQQAGVQVLWAANHWAAAIDCHRANHPGTFHLCQDLHQANWTQVPSHDILMASPACQGHSRSRGKEGPHHDASRSTAWAVVSCAEALLPPFFIVENVPDFRNWKLLGSWTSALQTLGYVLDVRILNAADFGVPQARNRLFIIGTLGQHPVPLELEFLPHVAANTCIDWEGGRWSLINTPRRAPKTLERVRDGRAVFGDKPFLIPYYGASKGGRDPEKPIGTLTTHDRYGLIKGDRMRMLSVSESKALMGFPVSYQLPHGHVLGLKLLGNAVCPPVTRALVEAIKRSAL